MKKRILIILLALITLFIIISASYIITKGNNLNNTIKSTVDNDLNNSSVDEIKTSVSELEYTNINTDSQISREIFNFVPKYFQSNENKMSNEYIIFSSICKLENEEKGADYSSIDVDGFLGYKSNLVEEAAKKMFGDSIKIQKQDSYNLPIGYNSQIDAYCKYPMSTGSSEEFQIIKELKENKSTFKLTIYALNVEYDINDLEHIYISTKNTFKLYKNNETDEKVIRNSMKEYTLRGIELDPTVIVDQYKEELPLIEYELEKLDDRGTKYFVKNIKLIVD